MLKINDFILHSQKFGLGIITKINNNSYEVNFLNYGIKNIVKIDDKSEFLTKLDDSLVSFVLDENKYSYNMRLIEKGKDYFKRGKVVDLTFTNNSIYSNVLGNYDYDVIIKFENNRIKDFDCSCPVDGLCKHIIATLFEAKKRFLELKTNSFQINQLDLEYEFETDNDLNINIDYDYTSFLDFYNAFNCFKEKYLNSVCGYLDALEKNTEISNDLLEFLLTISLLYNESIPTATYYCERVTKSDIFKKI